MLLSEAIIFTPKTLETAQKGKQNAGFLFLWHRDTYDLILALHYPIIVTVRLICRSLEALSLFPHISSKTVLKPVSRSLQRLIQVPMISMWKSVLFKHLLPGKGNCVLCLIYNLSGDMKKSKVRIQFLFTTSLTSLLKQCIKVPKDASILEYIYMITGKAPKHDFYCFLKAMQTLLLLFNVL